MRRLAPLLAASLLTGCGTDQPSTTACAEGELPDGDRCVPEACGTGTWGNLETSSGTIHVDGSSPSGGNGSESEPLSSIQDGLDAAGKSGHVVVAAGTYLETLELGSDHIGTTLEGRCRDLVIVDGSEGEPGPLSEPETLKASHTGVSPGSWTVSGLSIVNGQYCGVIVHSGELNLVDSTVADSAWANIAALGGTTNLLRVNVRDARVHESYGGSLGVMVDGAVLDATDCTISDNPGFGMYYSNASGRLEGCRLEGNRPNPDDHENFEGRGIHVRNGSTVEMVDCTVTDNRETGVMVLDSTVVLDGTTVERTGLATNGYGGRGVNLQEGATGEISNCRIRDNMDVALYVSSSSATVTGTEISGTLPDDALQGIGIVGRSSEVYVSDTIITESCGSALHFEGSQVTFDGIQVLDTVSAATSQGHGRAMGAYDGSSVEILDSLFQDFVELGIHVQYSDLTATGLTLLDVDAAWDGTGGRGLSVELDSMLELADCEIGNTREAGISLALAEATIDGLHIHDVQRDASYTSGAGLHVTLGDLNARNLLIQDTAGPGLVSSWSTIDLGESSIEDAQFAGIATLNSTSELSDITIQGVTPDLNLAGGVGVFATDVYLAQYLDPHAALKNNDPSVFTLRDSQVSDTTLGALFLEGNGSFQVLDNTLEGSEGLEVGDGQWQHGDAILVRAVGLRTTSTWDEEEGEGLLISGNSIHDSRGAGVFLDGTNASLVDNTWTDNTLDLVQQQCSDAVLVTLDQDQVDSYELCPEHDYHTRNLHYTHYLLEAEAGEE